MKTHNPISKKTPAKLAKTAILAIIIAILLTSLAQAGDWTQYTPSPTTNQIDKIRTLGTTAMAVDSAYKILLYNGTTWTEKNPPSGITIGTQATLDITESGQYYWAFKKNSSEFQIHSYDAITETWTLQDTITRTGAGTIRLTCINRGGGYTTNNEECWLQQQNNTLYGIGSTPDLTATNTIQETYANQNLYLIYLSGGSYVIQRYNGVSWVSESPTSLTGYSSLQEYDTNYRTINRAGSLRLYNQTSNAYDTTTTGFSATKTIINPQTLGTYSDCTNTSYICKTNSYVDYNATQDTNKGTTSAITAGHIDPETNGGWLGLANGNLYSKGSVNAGSSSSPVPETTYTLYSYSHTDTNITNIEGVVPISTTKTYAIAKKNGNLAIISYDHTNPSNIQATNLTTTSTATPRGIDSVGDVLMLATSQNAWVYNNSLEEDVATLQLVNQPQASTFSDNLETITFGGTGTEAYTCDTTLTDELIQYDTTNNGTITNTTSITCYDLATDGGGDYIYAYKGLSGVDIYNKSLSLITTMNVITSIGINNPRDVLSAGGNRLAITTGRNVIKIYDNTNGANPTFEWECRASDDIRAIELLTDQIIIIATTNALQVCNKNDTALYDAQNNYWVSKQLKQDNQARRDLRRTSNYLGFASAETTRFAIYEIQVGDLATTNIAPVITSLDLQTTTPCVNETIRAYINAYDQDTPLELGYEYACDGTTYTPTANPEFYCSYTTTGVKTIRAKAKDSASETTETRSLSVQTCNLTNTAILTTTIIDSDNTSKRLEGVLINIEGQTSTLTDASGYARLTTNAGTYNITISKTGYITQRIQGTLNAGHNNLLVYLEPTTTTDSQGNIIIKTALTIQVIDKNNNPINNALTTTTDPITAISTTKTTDANGQATHSGINYGIPLRISVGKTGYQSEFTETSLNMGETKTITITLLATGEAGNASSGRGCQDYVNGWILCEPLNTTGGNSCTQNSDCIGGLCQKTYGTCSNVNWTKCDLEGQDRGAWCATTSMVEKTGDWATRAILDNFLYFGLFLIIIILGIILIAKIKER